MKTFWVVEDRSKGGKWGQCSTYDTQADALDRLRYEATSADQSDPLVFLNSRRLKTRDGYEMRTERVESHT